jgi:hypothetical protein
VAQIADEFRKPKARTIGFHGFMDETSAMHKEVEFRSSRREQTFKTGGVGFSRKPGDQTKNFSATGK